MKPRPITITLKKVKVSTGVRAGGGRRGVDVVGD